MNNLQPLPSCPGSGVSQSHPYGLTTEGWGRPYSRSHTP